jgi:hypothetical protein
MGQETILLKSILRYIIYRVIVIPVYNITADFSIENKKINSKIYLGIQRT